MLVRIRLIGFAAAALLASAPAVAQPLIGTAFTYQGRLSHNGQAASGLYDVRFRLMTAASAGIGDEQVGSPVVFNDITLVDGLFTGSLDFGAGAFDGSARWLEVSIKADGGIIYAVLAPRQKLTPAPYAIGLALPFTGSATSNQTLFSLHQDGSGSAASFQITDPEGGNAIYLQSSSDSSAIYSFAVGTGEAGQFVVYNAASTASALVGQNIGFGTGVFGNSSKGRAGWFQITAAANDSDAVLAETSGTGEAVYAVNSSPIAGRAGWFRVTNATNPTEAFRADTYGTGSAGYFRILNAGSSSDALRAETNGSGSGLYGANTGNGAALELGPGAIKVAGAGVNTSTSVFTHVTSAGSILGNNTTINHPQTNGNPNAILIVTTNSRTGSTANHHPVGVGYSTVTNTWKIFNLGGEAMQAGVAFNVMVLRP